jgi:ribosomal protein L19E
MTRLFLTTAPFSLAVALAVWLDPQESAEIAQANSRSGVRKLLKDGHM